MSDDDSTPSPVSLRFALERATIEETRLRSITTHEEAVLINGVTGSVIWRKSGHVSSIDFDDDEIAQMRGQVLTHNHPRGWRYPADDPRRAGSSFSSTDIAMLVAGQLAEMRAVSPGYLHRVRPPALASQRVQASYFRTFVATLPYEDVRYLVDRYKQVVLRQYAARSSDGDDLANARLEATLWHDVMELVAVGWGVDYERKEWP
jgi:hypothetical protein